MKVLHNDMIRYLLPLLIFALNVSTASWWPVPWADEALFLDPAANYLFNGRFASSLWHTQPYSEPWISNAPLYSLMLSGWLRIFGFGLVQSRSLNMALQVILVCICVTWAQKRLRFRAVQSVVLTLLLMLPQSAAFMARNGRYDMLACLVSTIMVLCVTEGKAVRIALAITGFLMPWISLPTLAFTGAATWMMQPAGQRAKATALHLASASLGFVALYLFADHRVGGSRFLSILASLWLSTSEGGKSRAELIGENLMGLAADRFWLVAIFLFVGVLLVRREGQGFWSSTNQDLHKWIMSGCLSSTLCVLAYKMNILYYWMIAIPLAFLISSYSGWLGGKKITLTLGLSGSLLLLGLPLRLVAGIGQQPQVSENNKTIQEIIDLDREPKQPVVIYAAWPFYYEVKSKRTLVVGPRFVGDGVSSDLEPHFLVLPKGTPAPKELNYFHRAKVSESVCQGPINSTLGKILSGSINRLPAVELWTE